jgi:hypothetical protein
MMNESGKGSDIKWWINQAAIADLEREYRAWESGRKKGYSWVELKIEIARRKLEKRQRNKKSANK